MPHQPFWCLLVPLLLWELSRINMHVARLAPDCLTTEPTAPRPAPFLGGDTPHHGPVKATIPYTGYTIRLSTSTATQLGLE
jgi:hypothetical protein